MVTVGIQICSFKLSAIHESSDHFNGSEDVLLAVFSGLNYV